jgi:hypothetical protein
MNDKSKELVDQEKSKLIKDSKKQEKDKFS